MNAGASQLSGRRVMLRPVQPDDLQAIQRWRGDPKVTRYWISRAAPTLDELANWLQENRRTGSWTWLILDETGQPIGYADVFGINFEHEHAELAIMIGERSRWGLGYATESLMTLLGYLLASTEAGGAGLHKISLSVATDNLAARRVYRACGFQEDGVLRDDLKYDGRWHDQILMSVLANEFRALPD